MWFYPRTGSDQINAIVAYNYLEGTWWTGTLSRTTWIDREVYDNPIATEYNATATANNEVISGLTDGASSVFLHEIGNNGDGQAITAFVKSGVVQIGEGNEFSFVSKLIPDIEDQEGTLNAKLEFKNYPNNSTSVTKTVTFQDNTDFVRTTWIDREVYDNPIATEFDPTATANNEVIVGLTAGASSVFLHEQGNNGDGQAITAFVKSGVVQIGEGNEFSFVSKLIPDIEDQEGTLNAKLEFKNYPNNSTSVTKTVTFQDNTDFVSLRGRGREFTVNVVSNTTGTAWRLGTQRFDIQPVRS